MAQHRESTMNPIAGRRGSLMDSMQSTEKIFDDRRRGSVAARGSIAEGQVIIHEEDHGADSELVRRLGTRHLVMVSIGSSIGMGLWLGSGTSLSRGGPAAIFIGYWLAGTMAWAVNHSIGEMAVMYPIPSAFVQWTGKFVDPAAAFALGWAYWFGYAIGIANELQGIVTILGYWQDTHKVPTAGWLSIFLVVIILINIGVVTLFAEFEVVASSIKFFWIFVVIISFIVISAGGAPQGSPIGFRYWNAYPFTHGFKGFLRVIPTCIFAMSGSEASGIVAAECSNPKKSVPAAVQSIWLRLSLFYILGAFMVTIVVDPKDPDLFGNSGTNASPFVIAYRASGLSPLADIMNAIILISVLSSGSTSGYAGSRTVMGLASLGMAPRIFLRADKIGRPYAGLILVFMIGGGLCYLNVSNSGVTVFGWLSNLSSLFTLFGWGMICLSHLRFRHAWKAQGYSPEELPWRSWAFPYAAYWGLGWCILLIIMEFYLSVWPLDEPSTAENFFANYVSVILILILYIGAKFYYQGPLYRPCDGIDLNAGRRFYVDKTDEEALPPSRGGAMSIVRGIRDFLSSGGKY